MGGVTVKSGGLWAKTLYEEVGGGVMGWALVT